MMGEYLTKKEKRKEQQLPAAKSVKKRFRTAGQDGQSWMRAPPQRKIQDSRVKKTNKREICAEVEKMKKKNWNEMSFGVCKSTAEIAPHIKSFLSIIAGKKNTK